MQNTERIKNSGLLNNNNNNNHLKVQLRSKKSLLRNYPKEPKAVQNPSFQYSRNKKQLWETIAANDSPSTKVIAEKPYELIALAFIAEEHRITTRETLWVRERITGEKNLSETKKMLMRLHTKRLDAKKLTGPNSIQKKFKMSFGIK